MTCSLLSCQKICLTISGKKGTHKPLIIGDEETGSSSCQPKRLKSSTNNLKSFYQKNWIIKFTKTKSELSSVIELKGLRRWQQLASLYKFSWFIFLLKTLSFAEQVLNEWINMIAHFCVNHIYNFLSMTLSSIIKTVVCKEFMHLEE